MPALGITRASKPGKKKRTCLACGTENMKAGRRYCSKECRQQILWVLSLSKGLLRVFNARYAAFAFTDNHVMLDVLSTWSDDISRFVYERNFGKRPAQDLKALILISGKEWYHIISNGSSRSYASLYLLKQNHNKSLSPDAIKPNSKRVPRFSRQEKDSMKLLNLKMEELIAGGNTKRIKSAYKTMAKVYHPDVGGDTEKFKKLNNAHQQMLLWAQNPNFTSRKALAGCWSYDGYTDKWSPPL
jgi:hypothetical protein